MKKTDNGAIHKLFAMIILLWAVFGWGVLLEVMRAGYVSQYLEDSLTQANLAAILIDPYHYGSTGELIFENVEATRELFLDTLHKGLGEEDVRQKLGLMEDVRLVDFRVYEVTSLGIAEFMYDEYGQGRQTLFESGAAVEAPDGTNIQNSSIYAKIAVPVEFLFGVEVTAIKEHCVDIVSEESVYE